jgi:phosphoadenosine phosphosulfate reductase
MNQQSTTPNSAGSNSPSPVKGTPANSPPSQVAESGSGGSTAPEPDRTEDQVHADSTAEELVHWGLARFSDQPMVLTTSFGMEGCVLMDMCSQAIESQQLEPLTVACIDTGFFFPETKQLRKNLIDRYSNLNFVSWETPVSIQEQAKTYGDQLWKNNPNLCCNIRKVQPMRENIANYRLWITALRRSQTEKRADTPVLNWDWRYQLLKFCPLAAWSRADVWQYIQDHEVPFNQLHLQNYPSVSCFHCTKPVPGSSPDSEARKGRWADTDKDECGLHFSI